MFSEPGSSLREVVIAFLLAGSRKGTIMDVSERLAQLHHAAMEHVKATGPTSWAALRDRFPEVDETDFWDEIAWVQARHNKKLGYWPKGAASGSAAAQEQAFGPPEDQSGWIFQRQLDQHLADIERLRAASVDERGRVRDRRTFTTMLKLSEQALRLQHELRKEAYDVEKARRYLQELDALVQTFASPVRRQIRDRVARLNRAYGIAPTD